MGERERESKRGERERRQSFAEGPTPGVVQLLVEKQCRARPQGHGWLAAYGEGAEGICMPSPAGV